MKGFQVGDRVAADNSELCNECFYCRRGELLLCENFEAHGLGSLPVCIAKTQASISDNPKLKGAPTGWELNVREAYVSGGAGFIVAVCGEMMLMPGLAKVPAAMGIDIDDDGKIIGLK